MVRQGQLSDGTGCYAVLCLLVINNKAVCKIRLFPLCIRTRRAYSRLMRRVVGKLRVMPLLYRDAVN